MHFHLASISEEPKGLKRIRAGAVGVETIEEEEIAIKRERQGVSVEEIPATD